MRNTAGMLPTFCQNAKWNAARNDRPTRPATFAVRQIAFGDPTMTLTSFQRQVTTMLRHQFGDGFAGAVPTAPPAWYARHLSNQALLERNWAVFRERLAGESVPVLARRYGMLQPEVRQVSYAVLMALVRSRSVEPAERPVAPSSISRTSGVSPTSALARDCRLLNDRMPRRPGVPRMDVDHLVQLGISPETSLAQVPDERLLVIRGIGTRALEEIRRLIPFDPNG